MVASRTLAIRPFYWILRQLDVIYSGLLVCLAYIITARPHISPEPHHQFVTMSFTPSGIGAPPDKPVAMIRYRLAKLGAAASTRFR
jgi:hypothetical protein